MSLSLLSRCGGVLRTRWCSSLKGTPCSFDLLNSSFSTRSAVNDKVKQLAATYNDKYDEATASKSIELFSEQLRLNVLNPEVAVTTTNVLENIKQFLDSSVQHQIPALQWLTHLTKLGLRYRHQGHNNVVLKLVRLHGASGLQILPAKSYSFITSLLQCRLTYGEPLFSKLAGIVATKDDDRLLASLIRDQTELAVLHCSEKRDISNLLVSLANVEYNWSHMSAGTQSILLSKIKSTYTTVDFDSDVPLFKHLMNIQFRINPESVDFIESRGSTLISVLGKLLSVERKVPDFDKVYFLC